MTAQSVKKRLMGPSVIRFKDKYAKFFIFNRGVDYEVVMLLKSSFKCKESVFGKVYILVKFVNISNYVNSISIFN